ncbi:hypothetical protein MUN82_19635 [Hymenobacter aerilatus]|uniref:TonB C-terminal domain-containing protein n=1 Tax=Hymenobacter aerilatus TaxID=2932251 RepID=A0A8T9SZ83_9BACT|nr:hypothetical protein [Hymenobacter aerilatus]UOR05136.1 hypothetical protein MUN82_19635 [Hymenobacter aerilatus]
MPTSLPRPFLYFSLLGFLALLSPGAHAQTATPAPMPNALKPQKPSMTMLDGDKIYTYVEQMPAYLDGGMEGLQAFATSHVHGGAASGPLSVVTFIIDKTGKVRRPALGPTAAESEEAVALALDEAFSTIGQFRPGRQNGKPANVQFTVPLVKRVKAGRK